MVEAADGSGLRELHSVLCAFDVGDLIDDVLGSALNERKFEDMFVATRYTVNSGGTPVLECLGLFGQFMCSQPGAK